MSRSAAELEKLFCDVSAEVAGEVSPEHLSRLNDVRRLSVIAENDPEAAGEKLAGFAWLDNAGLATVTAFARKFLRVMEAASATRARWRKGGMLQ